jgi:hypothetical protein
MIDVLIRNLNEAFGYGVWVYDKNDATGQIRILHHIGSFEWKDFPIGERLPEPIFSTSTREGDILFDKFIDHLKEMGYGKDKLSIESGELKAMREHLADMKKLVFTPPPHFAPMLMGNTTSGFSMLGPMTPGRTFYSTPADLKISASRVLKAAKKCGNAAEVLKELFPEVFGPGWERFKDETH